MEREVEQYFCKSELQILKERMVKQFYDDLDATILNAMAAGVSLSQIKITNTNIRLEQNRAIMECRIGFMP